jgi:hypothetical protein
MTTQETLTSTEAAQCRCFDCGEAAYLIHRATGYAFCDRCAANNGPRAAFVRPVRD